MSDSKWNKIKQFSSLDRDERVVSFKHDQKGENLIGILNESLQGFEEIIKKTTSGSTFPSIVITGAPRSGTTYLNQLMASRLDVGYVSNLMARFYMVPLVGAFLQKTLFNREMNETQHFESTHGVTARVYEPHEFGYFWSSYLYCNEKCHQPASKEDIKRIDFHKLERILSQISSVFGQPVVYKCMIAPFVLTPMLNHTSIFFVNVKRKKEDVIRSILKVRKERLGTEKKWWSIRPAGWEKTLCHSPEHQVRWQYDKITRAIRKAQADCPKRCIDISYKCLVEDQESALGEIENAFRKYTGFSL